MFEKFLSVSAREFKQRYEGTYGFFVDGKGGRLLSRLDRVSLDAPRVIDFKDKRGIIFKLNADVDGEMGFEFLPPKSAFYNTKQGVYYTQRKAARQFQRGVTGHNTDIYQIGGGVFSANRVDFNALSAIYEQTIPFQEAYAKYVAGETDTISLSPNFVLSGKGKVFLLTALIGTYEREDNSFTVSLKKSYDLFRTELLDAFRRVNLPNVEIR